MDISRPHSPSSNSSAIDISSHPHSPSASHSAIPLAGPSSPSSLTTTTGNDLLGSFPRRRTSWGKLVENGQDPLQRDLFSDSMSHSQPPHHRSSSATDDDPFGSYSLDYVPPTQGQIQMQNSYGHGYGQPPYSTPRAGASTAALIHRDSTTSSDYDSIRERDDVRLTSHMSRQPTDDYDFPPSPPLDSPPSDDMVDSERGGGVGGGGGEGMRRRTVRYEGVQGGGGQMLHRTGSTFRNVSRGLRRVSLRVVNLAGKGLDEHTRLNDLPDDDDDMSASAPRTGSAPRRAFMILALWPSVTDSHDSRLIAAAAVNMCSSLGIDKATRIVEQFNARKATGEELSHADLIELADAEEKERLWVSLHNIESLVCLGTGRAVSSKLATKVENRKLPINVFTTVAQARDCRLGQQARLLDFLDAGLQIHMPDQLNQSDRYFRDVAEILFRLDGLHRQVRSLPVVTSYEPFYFHMLVASYYFCRVLFLMHTLHGLRATFPSQLDVVDHLRLKRNGTNFALNGARDALTSAEALLVTILSLPDDSMLSTAPDSFYAMISFASALIIALKFIMLHLRDVRQIPGATNQLLAKTVERLMQVALFPDHHAMRCARVIQGFIGKWDDHMAKMDGRHASNGATVPSSSEKQQNEHPIVPSQAQSPASSSTTPAQLSQAFLAPSLLGPQLNSEFLPSFDDFDFLQTNADGRGLGMDFWQYFADNPQVPIMQTQTSPSPYNHHQQHHPSQ